MARNKGTFNFAANFEPLLSAPLDGRQVVSNYSDLTNPVTWQDSGVNVWVYSGMPVYVQNDVCTNLNGLYVLTSASFYNVSNSWVKIATIDIAGTNSVSFQLNQDASGIILVSDGSTLRVENYAGLATLQSKRIKTESLNVDLSSGILVSINGEVFTAKEASGNYISRAYVSTIYGNGFTTDFSINHNLDTPRHNITMYDSCINSITYNFEAMPAKQRGLNVDWVYFASAPLSGSMFDIIVVGF
jgi:hypothetical protein